ncbi:hypothetical protein LSH36_1607g00013 [Paralvinella palmiformis]|uniref:G-protein coupled receptors family 1 profile domain-containing protein n=1 Tax=Paralvinella palmiformis TaxID=53620 RepID=A0AAD9IRV1_9ANNE|nr:hypothetical protein LSH36_1607g00013 [Paralvinella palmiformis]
MDGWTNKTETEITSKIYQLPLICLVVLWTVLVIGSAGNAFIVTSACLQKPLRMRCNVFIVNLAASDMFITCYVMPFGLVMSQYRKLELSNIVCNVNAFIVMCACSASIQFMMLIAVERFARICKMFWYRRMFKPQLKIVYVISCWIFAIVLASQGLTGWSRYVYVPEVHLCMFLMSYSLSYDVCLVVFGLFLPTLVMTACYVSIFKAIRRSRSSMASYGLRSNVTGFPVRLKRRRQRDLRLVVTLFTIVVAFLLFWSPAGVTFTLFLTGLQVPSGLHTASLWLALCNSGVNSLIYGILNRNFRQRYSSLFSRISNILRSKQMHNTHIIRIRNSTSLIEHTGSSSGMSRGTSADNKQINRKKRQSSTDTSIINNVVGGHEVSHSAHASLVSDIRRNQAKETIIHAVINQDDEVETQL